MPSQDNSTSPSRRAAHRTCGSTGTPARRRSSYLRCRATSPATLLRKSWAHVRLGPVDTQEFSVVLAPVTPLFHLLEALFRVSLESEHERPRLREHVRILDCR